MKRAVSGFLQIFSCFLLFLTGVSLVLLSYLPEARFRLVSLLLDEPNFFFSLGLGFSSISLFFILGFYFLSRGQFLRLKMGGSLTDIKEKVVRGELKRYLKNHFAKKMRFETLDFLERDKMEIGVKLKIKGEEEKTALLVEAEEKLKILLKERFGYMGPFYLTVRL